MIFSSSVQLSGNRQSRLIIRLSQGLWFLREREEEKQENDYNDGYRNKAGRRK